MSFIKNHRFQILFVLLTLLITTIALPTSAAELSLADEGPYTIGVKLTTLIDSARNDRTLPIAIWYPAVKPEDQNQPTYLGWTNPEPDLSNAPYPLILYSYWFGGDYIFDVTILRHLASHGFIVVSVEHGCDGIATCTLDRPADLLFVMDQLGEPDSVLAEAIDGETVGLMGISYGGYTSFATAGAELSPQNWFAWGEAQRENPILGPLAQGVMDHREEIEAYAEELGIVKADDHWAFAKDDRIKAVLAGVPANPYMYQVNGLNAVTVPTMMFAATADEFFPYDKLMVPIYSQIGAEERYLLSFVDYGHHIEWSATGEDYYKQFSVTFFSQYLRGAVESAKYLTADYIGEFDDLLLGTYEGEFVCHNACLDFPTIGQFFANTIRNARQ